MNGAIPVKMSEKIEVSKSIFFLILREMLSIRSARNLQLESYSETEKEIIDLDIKASENESQAQSLNDKNVTGNTIDKYK